MTEQQPGKIYWSPDAQQFYQVGRQGAVSRLTGIESLTVRESATGPRYYDEFGTRTPNPENLIPQYMQERFPGLVRNSHSTSADVYDTAPGDNSYYKTWYIYHDPSGGVHIGYINNRVGQTIDNEVELARIVASIGSEQEIDPNSDQGGSSNIALAIDATFHFIVS